MHKDMPSYLRKQLGIPGLPWPAESKGKKPTQEEQINTLEGRILKLELELSLLKILMEKGGK